MRFIASALAAFVVSVNAIYQNEAGVIDWHVERIGIPQTNSHSISPKFHRVVGKDGKAQAVFLTVTKKNVLAALNPTEGNTVWRRQYEEDDPIVAYKPNSDGLVTLSGAGGAVARIHEVLNGNLIWEAHLHKPEAGILTDATSAGAAIAFDKVDIFVLSNGHTVRRLTAARGEVKWGWTSPDQASSTHFTKIIRTSNALYVTGVTKSFRSLTLHVVSLNPETGEVLSSINVDSEVGSHADYQVLTSANKEETSLVWVDKTILKAVKLTPDFALIKKVVFTEKGNYVKLHELSVESAGYVAVNNADGEVHVFKLSRDALGLERVVQFETSAEARELDVISGGFDKKNQPYISKIAYSPSTKQATYQVLAPAAANGQPVTTGFTFPYDLQAHSFMTHVAIDVANPKELQFVSRMIVTSASGSLQQWRQENLSWTREESLSEIQAITVVELPESVVSQTVLENKTESFVERLVRQANDAKSLPVYIFRFVRRFLTGQYDSITPSGLGGMWRDAHGFKKIIVAATSTGKIFGIDTLKGDILWEKNLGVPPTTIKPVKLVPLKTISESLHPEVALVAEIITWMGHHTGVISINAVTGEYKQEEILHEGPPTDIFEVELSRKTLVVIDGFKKGHIYPDTKAIAEEFKDIVPYISFTATEGPPNNKYIAGYSFLPYPLTSLVGGKIFLSHPLWKSSFKPGESVVSIIRRSPQAAATHGKVLGDRSTLYKYSNPNTMAVVTSTPTHTGEAKCSVHLLDRVKGTILYSSALHSARSGTCDMKVSLVENWLVYHYWDDGKTEGTSGLPGWRMASVEFYEGGPDVKHRSVERSAYDPLRANISALEQSYVFPSSVRALTTTTTKFGISLKDVVVINGKRQVQTFARRLLDPRRPKDKPTAQQQEEMLVQYDPLLPDDSRRVISHDYPLLVNELLTSPTSLESTSIVIAYGHDLFVTRVSPSRTFDVLNESFNKIQLAMTVAGLGVAILVTRPLVRQKKLKARWQK